MAIVDVVIVGGGLAGAATALSLRRAGASVVVVDKASFPRDKPCGEGLLPHGITRLHTLGCGDILDAAGGQPFRGILYHCHGVVARGDFQDGALGRGIRRRHLDSAMRDRCAAVGVELIEATVKAVDVDGIGPVAGGGRHAPVQVTLNDGRRLEGRVLVGADGPRSLVRHSLGLDDGVPRRPRYALRQHFTLADGAEMPDRVEVHVQSGHELYVTPVEPGVVGVAALLEKPTMTALEGPKTARLRSLIDGCAPLQERLAGSIAVDEALACGPLRVRAKAVFKGPAVLVGDAAGYVDAITGEGMSLALHTALSASSAIEAVLGGASPSTAFERYARDRQSVFRDHALLTFGLVELARRPFFARRAIARLAKEPALFTRLLAVNDGARSLLSLGPVDMLKLALGADPSGAVAR